VLVARGDNMDYIWYEPLLHALRVHIEQNHMNEEDAIQELQYTEEFLYWEPFRDGAEVKLTCPWSQHCNCNWSAYGNIEYKLVPKSMGLQQ